MSPVTNAIVLAAGGNPFDSISTKATAIILAVATVAVAWAGLKVVGRAHKGNVKQDMNVAGSTAIGVFLFAVAIALGALVAWFGGLFGYFGLS